MLFAVSGEIDANDPVALEPVALDGVTSIGVPVLTPR